MRLLMKVTILIPALNIDQKLLKAVQSIRNDKYEKETQVVIVYDGGVVESMIPALLLSYNVKIYKNLDEGGVANALNYGLRFVDTEIVRRFDSDDLWIPTCNVIQEFEKNQNLAVISGRAISFEGPRTKFKLSIPSFDDTIVSSRDFISGNVLSHPATYIRISHLDAVSRYTHNSSGEDFDLWLKFKEAGFDIAYKRNLHVLYRRHDMQESRNLSASIISSEIYKKWRKVIGYDGSLAIENLEYMVCRKRSCTHSDNIKQQYEMFISELFESNYWNLFSKRHQSVHFVRLLISIFSHSKITLIRILAKHPRLTWLSLVRVTSSSINNYILLKRYKEILAHK